MLKGETEAARDAREFLRAAVVHGHLHRQASAMVVAEELKGMADFPKVVHAHGALRVAFGVRERGQQQCRQNPDDGDNHKQLDQSEPVSLPALPESFHTLKRSLAPAVPCGFYADLCGKSGGGCASARGERAICVWRA